MSRTAFALAAILLASASASAQQSPDDVLKQLTGEAPLTLKPDQFSAACASVLPKVLETALTDDLPLQKMVFRAGRPGAEAERAALSTALAAKLTANTPAPLKLVLLRHLHRIGRDEAVPAIAPLLNDADALVRESARRALAANPARSAADALRAAIDKATDPQWKPALVAALAFRNDPADLPTFTRLVADPADPVRIVALGAVARLGDASALPILADVRAKGSPAAQAAATDACLTLAGRLAAAGQKDVAAKVYRDFLTGTPPYRYAAITGLGIAGNEADILGLVELLADKDTQARGAALDVLSRHKSARIADAIAARLKTADASAKPWLIRALAAQDPRQYAATFVTAADDPDPAVRIAAIQALKLGGDASALPALLKSAQSTGPEQAAAREALELLPGGADIDKALVPLVEKGAASARLEAIRAVGARNARDAVPALLAAMKETDASLRAEATKSLGLVADQSAVPQVLQLILTGADDSQRDQTGRALAAILRKSDDDARLAPVIEALAKSRGPVRATLYSVLGQVGGDKALAALRDAARSSDDKDREAAIRALSTWTDPAPAADLLAIARAEPKEAFAILALRGHVRMIGMGNNKNPAADQIAAYQAALAAARRPEEKRQIIGGLGDLRDFKALEALAPFLADPQLANEAASAILKVAKNHAKNNPAKAAPILQQVIQSSKSDAHKKQAQEILDQVSKK